MFLRVFWTFQATADFSFVDKWILFNSSRAVASELCGELSQYNHCSLRRQVISNYAINHFELADPYWTGGRFSMGCGEYA